MYLTKTQEDLGERNRSLVLSEILIHGPLPRALIAERVGLTQASVSRITRQLIDNGLIEEDQRFSGSSGRGRKFVDLRIRPGGGFVAGIALNAFRQDVVLADIANGTIAEKRMQFDDLESAEYVLEQCAITLEELITESKIDRRKLFGCGVSITGAVDPDAATLKSAPALNWRNVDVAASFNKHLQMPLRIESIPNAKNLAARSAGPSKGCDNVVLINASLAIGTSLILDGRLIRGSESNAGLIESMVIPNKQGQLQPVHQVAGGIGVIENTLGSIDRPNNDWAPQLIKLIAAAENGDTHAQQGFSDAGKGLAYLIHQMDTLLHPQVILISGPLIECDAYSSAIRKELNRIADENSVRDSKASERIRFLHISSHQATQSLAIYHFLIDAHSMKEPLAVVEGV